jgi:hypothetical protein
MVGGGVPEGRVPACRRCGHPRSSHEHWRPGNDCGTCGCRQYKPERWWRRAWYWPGTPPPRRTAAPVTAGVLRPRPVPYPVPDRTADDDRTRLDVPLARPFVDVPRQHGRHASSRRRTEEEQ